MNKTNPDVNELQQRLIAKENTIVELQTELDFYKKAYSDTQRFHELSLDCICTADFDGYFTSLNPAFERILGYSAEELSSKRFIEFVHPEDKAATLEEYEKILRGQTTLSFENRYLCKDGSYKWISWMAVPIVEEKFVFAIARDITSQKDAETRLKQHQEKIAKLSRVNTVVTLVSGLAHEINQPLASITLYTETCLEKAKKHKVSQEIIDILNKVVAQAERAGEIIHRIKKFLRKGQLSKSSHDINKTITACTDILKNQFKENHITINYKLDKKIEKFFFDRIQIEQVILNLLNNAIESLKENKINDPQITILTEKHNPAAIIIKITDNGPGLDDNDIAKIFEPLYSTKLEGMGMGLSISQSIMEAHNGNIQVEQMKKQGACFLLTLPIALGI